VEIGMDRRKTTEAIESSPKVGRSFYVFDFFFVFVYVAVSFSLKSLVHERLQIPYMIFSFLVAIFLTIKSTGNKKRRNFESIYFLLKKDINVYRPYIIKEDLEATK
jgi:hypothetical protein